MSRSIRPHKPPSAAAPTSPTPHVPAATLPHPQLPSAPRLPGIGPAPALDLLAASTTGPGLFEVAPVW